MTFLSINQTNMKNIYYFSTAATKYRNFEWPSQEFTDMEDARIKTGEKLSADWPKITLAFENDKKRIPDFPYFSTLFPIFSERAVDALHDLIAPYVEFLPVEVANSEKKFWGVNVWTIYDTLDLPRCDYEQIHRTFFIDTFAFKDDIFPEAPIFRIREISYLKIFIGQEFRDIVEKKHLTGLRFEHKMNLSTDYRCPCPPDATECNCPRMINKR